MEEIKLKNSAGYAKFIKENGDSPDGRCWTDTTLAEEMQNEYLFEEYIETLRTE